MQELFIFNILAILIPVIVVAMYVFSGLGLMDINSRIYERGSWMAWVPIFNMYLIGKLGFSKLVGWVITILILLAMKFTYSVNGVVKYSKSILPDRLDTVALVIAYIMIFVSLYKIYSKFSNKAAIMIIFTILTFGLLAPVFLFAIRNNEYVNNVDVNHVEVV